MLIGWSHITHALIIGERRFATGWGPFALYACVTNANVGTPFKTTTTRYNLLMVAITLELDDESARQLKARATRAGITVEDLAASELSNVSQDPFEFVGIGEASVSALDTNGLLADGFGSR